jgi:hypothetical protein
MHSATSNDVPAEKKIELSKLYGSSADFKLLKGESGACENSIQC